MATDLADHLRWRCVACGSNNHVSLGQVEGDGHEPTSREVTKPVETACAHCRTRHILVGDPGDLARIAPRDEIGRRGGRRPARVLLGAGLAAAGGLGLYIAAQTSAEIKTPDTESALVWVVLGLGAALAGGNDNS